MRLRMLAFTGASLLLALGTLLVFVAIDSHSHSASDTIRPFIITMAPIWVAFALVIWAGNRSTSRRPDDE